MSPQAVYVLVFDLTKNLSATAQCKVKCEGQEEVEIPAPDSGDTNLDHIMRWLDLVHSLRNSEGSEKLPPVLIVGTHSDCADSNGMDILRKFLSRNVRVFCEHIVQTLTIDNNRAGQRASEEDPQILKLRKEILSVADTLPHTKIEVPLKWLEVENKVFDLSKRGEKYMTRRRFKAEVACLEGNGSCLSDSDHDSDKSVSLVDDSNCCTDDEGENDDEGDIDEDDPENNDNESNFLSDDIDADEEWDIEGEVDEEDDFEHLLHFLHDRGTIVYHNRVYNPDGLVVLDPQWLIDVLCKIITAKQQEKESLHILSLRQDLQEKGILHSQLLDHACKNLELCDIKDSLLFIMKRFNLLCECKDERNNPIYLVPCMLTTKPVEDLMGPILEGHAPVYITFNTNYVPAGLFSRLLVLFGKWAASKTSCEQQQLFANGARFFVGNVTCLGFASSKSVIKVHIWTMDNSNPIESEPVVSSEVSR